MALTARHVFAASRLSPGNALFPDELAVEHDGVAFRKRRFIGCHQEFVPYHHVASVTVERGVVFASIIVETTGGIHNLTACGLTFSDAEVAAQEIRHRLRCRDSSTERRSNHGAV